MTLDREIIAEVVSQTEVLRLPKQSLATFGITAVDYYIVTEPVYAEIAEESRETVVRRGKLTAEKPQIVTPYYLISLFQGFEHGVDFAEYLMQTYGSKSPGLLYSYRQELQDTSVISDPLPVVAGRIVDQLDKDGENLSAVIRGIDHLWDISLMKFIYELTASSLVSNISELSQHGLLQADRGLPRAARLRIDEMFAAVAKGRINPSELKAELDRWGVFEEYEDRFLTLFRRR